MRVAGRVDRGCRAREMRDYSGAQLGLKQQHDTPRNDILVVTLCVLLDIKYLTIT
jgi:hypothetical protein